MAEDYQPLLEQIQNILLNITDPVSKRQVIKAVHRREDIYHGPFLEKAPDLVIEWNSEVLQNSISYSVSKELIIIQPPKRIDAGERWTGDHRPYGIFIAYGPDIKRGATVANATLYDIAPTILYLRDHPIPKDVDGKVLTDIFTETHLNRHPIQYSEPPDVQWKVSAAELDAEETHKIEERLRGLGYIE